MGCQAQLEGLERFVFAVAAGSLVCTYHKGSQEQAAGVRAGSEKGVAYHIASSAPAGGNDGVVFLDEAKGSSVRAGNGIDFVLSCGHRDGLEVGAGGVG